MNVIPAVKRSFFVLLTASGLALYALGGADPTPCPLPITYSTTPDSTNSPEQPKCLRAVIHNGMKVCLPCPAYDAHRAHGDADAGPCDKPGNMK